MKKYSVAISVDGSYDTLDEAEVAAAAYVEEHGYLSATVAEVICTYERLTGTSRKLPDEPAPPVKKPSPVKTPARKRKYR